MKKTLPTQHQSVPDKKANGFTILELVIVITIVSILAVVFNTSSQMWLENANKQADSLRLNSINTILQNYYVLKGTLPCPALPNIPNTNSADGVATTGCFTTCPTGITCNTKVATGAIPYKALGIPPELTKDQQGNRYSYIVDLKFTNASCQTSGRITVKDANANIITSQAMFALVAFGKTGNGAYNANTGTLKTCVLTNADKENCNNDEIFIQRDEVKSSTATLVYDDFVFYSLNPNQLNCPKGSAGCNVWLDGADRCTVDIDTSNRVASWYDKSNSNLILTQATAASKPIFQTTAANYLNGKPYLTFTNQFLSATLTTALNIFNISTSFTNTMVFRTADLDGAIFAINSTASITAGIPYRLMGLRTTGVPTYYLIPTTLTTTTVSNNSIPHIVTAIYDSASAKIKIYIDGVLANSIAYVSVLTLPATYYMIIGGSSTWSTYTGDVMEFVGFNRTLTDGERVNLEKNLAAKWAIPY